MQLPKSPRRVITNSIPYLLAAVLLIGVWYVLVQPIRSTQGMWYSHDDVQVVRTQEMVKELQRGQFPVRMLHDLGNGGGYLLFNFYPPLAYYLTAGLVLFGTSPLNAVKLLFQVCFLIGGAGTFLYIRYLTKSKLLLPLFGSLLFMTAAYFTYDIFIRGALAETLGFALVPVTFLSLEIILHSQKRFLPTIFFSLCVALLVYAHAITAIGFFLFLGLRLGMALVGREKVRYLNVCIGLGVSLLLSASFLLPLILESPLIGYQHSELVNAGFLSSFSSLTDLFGLVSRQPQFVPKSIGLGLSLLVGLSALIVLRQIRQKTPLNKHQLAFLLASLLLSILLQMRFSGFLWQNLIFLRFLQFPFRLLVFTSFFAISFSMLGFSYVKNKFLPLVLLIGYLLVVFVWQQQFMKPTGYYFAAEFKAEDDCATTTWEQELLPVWVKECLPKNTTDLVAENNEVQIIEMTETNNNSMVLKTDGPEAVLVLNKYFYPGWQVQVDSHNLQAQATGSRGLLSSTIPSGTHQVVVTFGNTRLRALSDLLTVVGVVLVVILFLVEIYGFIQSRSRSYKKNRHLL